LFSARERTRTELERVRRDLAQAPCPPDASVVVFGSWGRGELTEGSDEDWAILVDGAAPEGRVDIEDLDQAVRVVLGAGERKPGTQDVFGCAFGCDKLVEQIGLDKDTNRLLTRRMLLLLESAPVLNPDAHGRCRTRVLDTYLQRGSKDFRVPRFLLKELPTSGSTCSRCPPPIATATAFGARSGPAAVSSSRACSRSYTAQTWPASPGLTSSSESSTTSCLRWCRAGDPELDALGALAQHRLPEALGVRAEAGRTLRCRRSSSLVMARTPLTASEEFPARTPYL
jgi:hypothetical protein